jgi:hypothetical protein
VVGCFTDTLINNSFKALVKHQYDLLLILFIVNDSYLAMAHERRNILLIDLLFGLFWPLHQKYQFWSASIIDEQ